MRPVPFSKIGNELPTQGNSLCRSPTLSKSASSFQFTTPKSSPFTHVSKKRIVVSSINSQCLPESTSLRRASQPDNAEKQTIQIFQHALKTRKIYIRPKAVVNPTIRGDHSPEFIKFITEQAQKEYIDKKKSMVNGLMYINELWDTKYEKKTINACKINKRLLRIDCKNLPNPPSFKKLMINSQSTTSSRRHEDHPIQSLRLSDCNSKSSLAHFEPDQVIWDKGELDSSRHALELSPLYDDRESETAVKGFNKGSLMKFQEKDLQNIQNGFAIQPISARSLSNSNHFDLVIRPNTQRLRSSQNVELPQTSRRPQKSSIGQRRKFSRPNSIFSGNGKEEKEIETRSSFRRRVNMHSPHKTCELGSFRFCDPSYFMEAPISAREKEKNKLYLQEKEHDLNEILNKCKDELDEKTSWRSALKNFGDILGEDAKKKRLAKAKARQAFEDFFK